MKIIFICFFRHFLSLSSAFLSEYGDDDDDDDLLSYYDETFTQYDSSDTEEEEGDEEKGGCDGEFTDDSGDEASEVL